MRRCGTYSKVSTAANLLLKGFLEPLFNVESLKFKSLLAHCLAKVMSDRDRKKGKKERGRGERERERERERGRE